MKILGPWRRPRHRTVLPGSNLSEAAIGVAIRSCPGVQPRRSYSRLHAIIADSASFANSADRFANNFASDNCDLANAIELRLTQHLPAIVPIEIARIFLRRTFWVRKPQYASPASFRRELPRQAMEFGSQSHKGQGERECLHVFNATKHAHVTESANLLLERIWRVEDQDLLMVFEIQLVEGCRRSVMDSAGCERSRCGHITGTAV